jgi:FkbM family methyltransferase
MEEGVEKELEALRKSIADAQAKQSALISEEMKRSRQEQKNVNDRVLRELRALNEYTRNRDKTNQAIVRDIMSTGASFPTIVGMELEFYGQVAEDLLVESLLAALVPERSKGKELSYLDIGSNHPISTSNTYRFYKGGMRGVLVEPIPELAAELRRIRPRDVVLEVGVRFDERAEAELYVCDHHEISSFNREFIQDFVSRNQFTWEIVKTVKVPLLSANEIMERHFETRAPDFVNIDVESLDYEILTSIDFDRHRPTVICIEPSDDFVKPTGFASNTDRMTAFMTSVGYRLMARTRINLIYIDEVLGSKHRR